MATYAQALTALIDQRFKESIRNTANLPEKFHPTRDQVATESENIRIAVELFGERGVSDEFYEDPDIDFGIFDNCREYGLTVTINGWTFCAYEHRNSDAICIEGCPTAKVKDYGPYGGEDKYDVLFRTIYRDYTRAAVALISMMKAVRENPNRTRPQLKRIA